MLAQLPSTRLTRPAAGILIRVIMCLTMALNYRITYDTIPDAVFMCDQKLTSQTERQKYNIYTLVVCLLVDEL